MPNLFTHRRTLRFLIGCALFGLSLQSSLWAIPKSQQKPPSYYEDFGACPFECCTYREWVVVKPTVFYKNRDTKSPIIFRTQKGEHITGLTGVVITLKLGKAIMKRSFVLGDEKNKIQAKRGDVLYLLHYEGEGCYKFWLRGRIISEQIYSDDFIPILSEPKTVWWVKVKNRKGQIGWSLQPENFGNIDACG